MCRPGRLRRVAAAEEVTAIVTALGPPPEVEVDSLNLVPEKYRGLYRFDAREMVVADINAAGLAATAHPGRLEPIGLAPRLVVDGAHNPAGAAALRAALTDRDWQVRQAAEDVLAAAGIATVEPLP